MHETKAEVFGPCPPATSGPTVGDGCEPAYPTACIRPPLPDLNYRDIPPEVQGAAARPDGFDGEEDGINCER